MAGPVNINSRPPGRAKDVTVEAFVATIVCMCPCGNRKPITVPVIPGADGRGQCSQCQVTWSCERIDYEEVRGKPGDEQPEPRCVIRMHGTIPAIIVPGNGGEKRMVI